MEQNYVTVTLCIPIVQRFARSVRVKLPGQLLHCRSGADASPAHVAATPLVRYTHRPFGHQRTHTKRLTDLYTI